MRQNYNEGQEIIFQDLNKGSSRTEKLMFDTILFELMGRNSEGFFQDSLNVSRVSTSEVSVKQGVGFQLDQTDSFEPDMKPVVTYANTSLIVPAANPSQDRIDIICVKAALESIDLESRKFKDAQSSLISNQNLYTAKRWKASFQVVSGNPAITPVAPAVPAGYVKIAEVLIEASNGIVSESNITDTRSILPLAGSVGASGSKEYDAIVGDTSILGVTHATLKEALDAPEIVEGSKILVTRSENVGITPEVTKNNIEIVFKPSVTFTKDGVDTGLLINADGCKLTGARFADFSTAGDKAIEISATRKYNIISQCRFSNCDTEIENLTGKNVAQLNIAE